MFWYIQTNDLYEEDITIFLQFKYTSSSHENKVILLLNYNICYDNIEDFTYKLFINSKKY